MVKNWFYTAVLVGVTSLTLLIPDTSFAQRGGRGGNGGGRGGNGGGRGWEGGRGGWGVGGYGGWGVGGYGGWGYPGYAYGSASYPIYSYPASGGYDSAVRYMPATSADSFYYNPGDSSINSQQGNTVRVQVRVPSANARVQVGEAQTQQTGTTRFFVSPALEPGYNYTYHISAHWTDSNGQPVVRQRDVAVQPGGQVVVDFSQQMGTQSENIGQPGRVTDRERSNDRDRTTQPDRTRPVQPNVQPDRIGQPQPSPLPDRPAQPKPNQSNRPVEPRPGD